MSLPRPNPPRDVEPAGHPEPRLRRRTLLSAAALSALAGCGGGGSAEVTPTALPQDERLRPLGGIDGGGTGDLAMSFFSVCLTRTRPLQAGGTRFDTRQASVQDADGRRLDAAELEAGMTARIDAARVVGSTRASRTVALAIVVGEQAQGAVAEVDAANDRFTLLGQRIQVTAATVFDAALAGGLAALQPGQRVRAWGQFDPVRARVVASRVDRAVSAQVDTLRAVLTQLDTGAPQAVLGGVAFGLAPGVVLDPGLRIGAVARARIDALQGVIVELQVDALLLPDRKHSELEGRVTSFESPQRFAIDGVPVDASHVGAARLAAVAPGARVQAAGRSSGGVLLADTVQVEDDAGDPITELEGRITAISPSTRSFVLRGVLVSWNEQTRFVGGLGPAGIEVRRMVAVKGTLAPDGRHLEALQVHLER